ncbi:PH domain-containing protein [Mangrovimonas sp. TPBH4]|uniref:PH domain-containing protein n=1 Tax=Mangrovimonas sp. TPBH4 TaxID=1645914 RepID=UPI0006B5BC43|nr:PH domain-containing protein [Mangrovimonas sp. TPBH4]
MTKKYPSKVSYGLLLFIFLIFYGPLIPNLIENPINGKTLVVVGLLSLVFAFIVHPFLKTKYIIRNKQLDIKFGMFSYQPIDIRNIKEISKTTSKLSSPAPSFDRIEIKYGQFEEVIISPKDQMNFVKDLTEINPNIKTNIVEP